MNLTLTKEKTMPQEYWKYMIMVSLWICVNIFWPNFSTPSAQFMAWEFSCISLFGLSYFFEPLRKSHNLAPSIFLVFAVISVFTHGINPVYLEGLTQVLLFVIAFCSIVSITRKSDLADIKKTIVLIAFVNVLFGIGQALGYRPLFVTDQVIGFIGQKWNFGVICAAALPFAIEWNVFVALFIMIGVILCDKYAVYIPVAMVLFMNQKIRSYPKKIMIPFMVILALSGVLYKTHFFKVNPDYKNVTQTELNGLKGEMDIKVKPRLAHWGKMLGYSLHRPLDGWGLNSYANHVWSKDKPGQIEMHSEPLNMLFEGGIIGLGILFGWFNYIRRRSSMFNLDATTTSLFIFLIDSIFHSCFHSPNVLFEFMVILAIWEIERGASKEYGQTDSTGGSKQPSRNFNFNKLFKRSVPKSEFSHNGGDCSKFHPVSDWG